jgi:hypothetical protein
LPRSSGRLEFDVFCILHITDLHRSPRDPLSNEELISALVSDRDGFLSEDPPIALPQAIVVSGDIIQGVGLGVSDAASALTAQYDTAHAFLAELTDRFLDGDRSKVVIVPGNHDIDWNAARAAMTMVAEAEYPPALLQSLNEPNSLYRWDWKTRTLYKINDTAAYQDRLAAFWQFFENFYSTLPADRRPKTWVDFNLYSLDDGRIGVAAFNSCASNDCFAFQGEIPKAAIGRAYLDLKERGPWRLRIAVWHHDIEGPPQRSDYMDPEIVRGMIGRGFRLGLYGHQHKPQITPQHVYIPGREEMAIASAGSLCAGALELPTGARRGYSVIEISDNYDQARVHVREMAFANLFSRANLAAFGGLSYVDLKWTRPVDAGGRPETPERDRLAGALLKAEAALREGEPPPAVLELLRNEGAASEPYGRRLITTAGTAARMPAETLAALGEPSSIEELILVADLFLAQAETDEADRLLADYAAVVGLMGAPLEDMRKRIEMTRRMKR